MVSVMGNMNENNLSWLYGGRTTVNRYLFCSFVYCDCTMLEYLYVFKV